jgi:hypothetical protein
MTTHVVVTCSKRKRTTSCTPVRLGQIRGESVETRVDNWICGLEDGGNCTHNARDLYVGEQWSRLRKLENEPGLPEDVHFWILSAGYGLIPFEALIRPYGATFSKSSRNSVFDPSWGLPYGEAVCRWWRRLGSWVGPADTPRSIDRLAAADPSSAILVAASPVYLSAIRDELDAAVGHLDHREALLVFSGGSGRKTSRELEFDSRLRGRFGGSLMALNVNVLAATLQAAIPLNRTAVQDQLDLWMSQTPPLPSHNREPLSDEAVRRYISSELDEDPGAKWTPLLRKLRDDVGHACEQKRFRALFMDVANVTQ